MTGRKPPTREAQLERALRIARGALEGVAEAVASALRTIDSALSGRS